MKVAILGSRGGWHEARLAEALRARDVTVAVVPITRLIGRLGTASPRSTRPSLEVQGERLEACRAVLVRAIPSGSLEQVIFRVDALHRLTQLGVDVVNSPRCLERSVDKFLASTLLQNAALPTPRTIACERFEDAMAAFEELGGDVVVKPLFGAEGRGMVRLSDGDLAYRTFRALELGRAIFYLQAYLPHGDQDVRAFVVGDRVVAAMTRYGRDWRTNVSQGARVEPVELSPGWAELAIRAARALEADYAGVDLLPADAGSVFVLEVNGIPGWQGLQRTTEADVAGVIADHVLQTTRCGPAAGRGPAIDQAPTTGPIPNGVSR